MGAYRAIESYENFYGLFVGIEKYKDNFIGNLYCCEEDAEGMYQTFQKKLLNHCENNSILLINQEATREKILGTLSGYMNQAKPNDLLLLFVSTHGAIKYNDYFFMPYDGDSKNLLGTGISSSLLINALSTISSRGVKVLLIIDTCHSGAIEFDISKYAGEFSCLFSSSPLELSYEHFEFEFGIFTYFIIKGLTGAMDEPITLRKLYDYVYSNVQEKTNKRQNPLLVGTMDSNINLLSVYKSITHSKTR